MRFGRAAAHVWRSAATAGLRCATVVATVQLLPAAVANDAALAFAGGRFAFASIVGSTGLIGKAIANSAIILAAVYKNGSAFVGATSLCFWCTALAFDTLLTIIATTIDPVATAILDLATLRTEVHAGLGFADAQMTFAALLACWAIAARNDGAAAVGDFAAAVVGARDGGARADAALVGAAGAACLFRRAVAALEVSVAPRYRSTRTDLARGGAPALAGGGALTSRIALAALERVITAVVNRAALAVQLQACLSFDAAAAIVADRDIFGGSVRDVGVDRVGAGLLARFVAEQDVASTDDERERQQVTTSQHS